MKFTTIFTGEDKLSHFKVTDTVFEKVHLLGNYSKKYPAKEMMFRDFEKGAFFDWHTAPQPQFIIYLEGEVEVEASDGETRIFKAGDVLFATDLTGKGHITRMLTSGKSVIVTTEHNMDNT